MITWIWGRYRLKDVPEEKREIAERALSMHKGHCPAAVIVKRAIAIECSSEFEYTGSQTTAPLNLRTTG